CPSGGSRCNGACVDEQSDRKNCGACGHDCLGAVCASGKCQPVTLVTGQDGCPGKDELVSRKVYQWKDQTPEQACKDNFAPGTKPYKNPLTWPIPPLPWGQRWPIVE